MAVSVRILYEESLQINMIMSPEVDKYMPCHPTAEWGNFLFTFTSSIHDPTDVIKIRCYKTWCLYSHIRGVTSQLPFHRRTGHILLSAGLYAKADTGILTSRVLAPVIYRYLGHSERARVNL